MTTRRLILALLVVASVGIWLWSRAERPDDNRQPPPATVDATPNTGWVTSAPPPATDSSRQPSRDSSVERNHAADIPSPATSARPTPRSARGSHASAASAPPRLTRTARLRKRRWDGCWPTSRSGIQNMGRAREVLAKPGVDLQRTIETGDRGARCRAAGASRFLPRTPWSFSTGAAPSSTCSPATRRSGDDADESSSRPPQDAVSE